MNIEEILIGHLAGKLLKTDNEIKIQFRKAAESILRNCMISFNNNKYQISEIEFYYCNENHPDPFVHKHGNQKKMGIWYFHGVGQDITFGDETSYGGILIRGIKNMVGNEYADGPIKVFDKLFNESCLRIKDRHHFKVTASRDELIDKDRIIYAFPRVGLQPTKDKQGIEYLLAPYRFLSFPEFSRNDRNVIYFYLSHIYKLKELPAEITSDSATLRYYDQQFRQGKEMLEEEYKKIMRGDIKMSVTNKCRLLGYHFKDRLDLSSLI